jgi:hypothetical protein
LGKVAVGAVTLTDLARGNEAAGGGADAQLASKALASAQLFRTERLRFQAAVVGRVIVPSPCCVPPWRE